MKYAYDILAQNKTEVFFIDKIISIEAKRVRKGLVYGIELIKSLLLDLKSFMFRKIMASWLMKLSVKQEYSLFLLHEFCVDYKKNIFSKLKENHKITY